MSKEIAQTVGGKKLGYLLGILAAFAVIATLGYQWNGASATVTPGSYTINGPFTTGIANCAVNPGTGTAVTVAPNSAVYCVDAAADGTIANPVVITVNAPSTVHIVSATPVSGPSPSCTTPAAGDGNSIACTYSALTGTSTYGLAVNVTLDGAVVAGVGGATTSGAMNATADDASVQLPQPFGINTTSPVVSQSVTLAKSAASVPIGGGTTSQTILLTNTGTDNISSGATITDTVPAGVTVTVATLTNGSCVGTPPFPAATTSVVCTTTGIVGGGGGSTQVTLSETVAAQSVFTSIPNTATCHGSFATGPTAISGCTATGAISVGSGAITNVELKHVNEAGNIVPLQDVINNVRGARHNVCLFAEGTGNISDGHETTYGPYAAPIPLDISNINVNNGGFFMTPGDQTPTLSDVQFYTGTTGNATGATCFSWTSSGAGDQELSLVVTIGGTTSTFDYDTDRVVAGADETGLGSPLGATNFSIVKEWNVLQTSWVYNNLTGSGTPLTPATGAGTISAATACVALGSNLVTVTNGALFAIGQVITIGTQTFSITAITGNTLTVNTPDTMASACALAIVTGGTGNSLTFNLSKALTLNPGAQLNQLTAIPLSDQFVGSHTTRTGAFLTQPLVGVNWNVSLTGCGEFTFTNPSLSGQIITTGQSLNGTTTLDAAVPSASQGVTNFPAGNFDAGPTNVTNCAVGSTATLTFTGTEPGVIGSGPGNTVIEIVNITFTQSIPIKQVLLAWAGQRIMLEHDWRIPPGDSGTGGGPSGVCPWGAGTGIIYAKSAEGPGSFVQALGAVPSTTGGNTVGYQPDAIVVSLTGDNSQIGTIGTNGATAPAAGAGDAPLRPQDACISRAMYESEDQGEVDIEAFANLTSPSINGDSKWAVVIYYMKLNAVVLSAVTQDTNIYHNATNADWAPGNPWDATKDAASPVSQNVSTDLLMRGRVTGWFLNSNPSGRAADSTNPQNVLPADRWVMPDDWVNIAGGAALASTFRPSYDLMFAPNNTVGLALFTPQGYTGIALGSQVALIKTGSGTGSASSPILVTSTSGLCSASVSAPCTVSFQIGTTVVTGTIYISPTTGAAYIILTVPFPTAPAVGTPVFQIVSGDPFVGPYSLIDIPGFSNVTGHGAALNNGGPNQADPRAVSNVPLYRDTTKGDGVVNIWDAPMPPSKVSVNIRGTGLIRQVYKENVYYIGTPGAPTTQVFPNPYYYQNIPESPYLAPIAIDGGYLWNSWGNTGPNTSICATASFTPCAAGQGPYHFWQALNTANNGEGANAYGVSDSSVAPIDIAQLAYIRTAFGDPTMSRDFVVYSDNHGELMFIAFGDFKTDLSACATNVLGGGKQCKTGDAVGTGTITAVADYPDFQKHFPVASNAFTVNWTWGGYKDVTVEAGETDQFKYLVFHAIDRDGFCDPALLGAVSLHPVYTLAPNDTYSYTSGGVTVTNPSETVDFLIDSGQGAIIATSGGGAISGEHGNVSGVPTFSTADNTAAGTPIKQFPLSPLAASGQADECQAWIKISNSLLGQTNVLAIAHDDEGNIGFDKVIDLTSTMSYTLNFRWSLITWNGADNIPVGDALKGGASTKNPAGNDISAEVTAVYGWDASTQGWLAYFPSGVNVPGANNLTALTLGNAYWIAITGPGSVTWTVSTNVG